jgi:PAS domain S-box-containing protein
MPASTGARRPESVVREDPGRPQAAFNQAGVGIALVGPDGRWIWVNQALCDIVGYRLDEMMRLSFCNITHPEDLDVDLAQARQLLAGEISTYATQKRYLRKDGTVACTTLTVSLVRTPEGQPDYSIAVVEDVSRLRLSEELFHTLADSIPQLCWMADPNGHIVWFNRRWVEYTGTTLEQLWGRKLRPVLDPEAQPEALERWVASVAEGEPFDMELPLRGRDGVSRPFLTRVQPVRDDGGRVAWWFGTHTDISELKQAEAALRESERIHRIVADNTYDFEFWSDPEGRYLYVSPSCERVSGYRPAEFLADPDLLRRIVHPEDRPLFEERMRAVGAERPSVEFEYRIVHRDGTIRWLAKACQPVLSERGEYLGARGSNREVTDRKRAEEALREADRRKDEFLVTLAHELRNPLAPIRNSLQILRLSADPQDREHALDVMQRQLGQVAWLVDDLMDVSRISMGKLELRKEPTQLQSVVQAAVETSRPLIEHMGHELTVVLPDEPMVVDADPIRLGQVMSNLLINSAKYTDRGGRIRLTAGRDGPEAVVSVRDNGIGIAPDQIPGLFQLYRQVEHSLGKAQGGLGIGLSLVKRLVELHGGRIEVRSEGLGKGSEFLVRLRLVATTGPPPAAERIEAPSPKPSLRILVVDDNLDSAHTLARLLRLTGYEAHTAHDGGEAIEAAERYRPDVIVLDISLPVMDGYDVARAIRSRPWGGGIVIVALTGWVQDGDLRRSMEAGIDRHLVKPVDPAALEALLADLGQDPVAGE